MKKNTVAIEISHKFIKVVFGYVQNNQVYVTLVKKFPINHLLENGTVKERAELIKELTGINPIVDHECQVNRLINNVSLVLPPYGLELYTTKQFTSVISEEKIVSDLDIKNLYNLIKNKKLPVNNVLVDIIPTAYMIDSGEKFALAPIGKVSSGVEVYCKVFTLPERIVSDFSELLSSSNITINRKVASSFASSELISSYGNAPEQYFLVDIGACSTNVSFIAENQLFATRSFSWGGDNITDKIVSNFNISEAEGEKIKILFGLDKRQMKFEYPVCKTVQGEDVYPHYVKDLNAIIESELNNFYGTLQVILEQFAKTYEIKYSDYPIFLIGGGSKLKGLCEFLNGKDPFLQVKPLTPKTIGARDPSLFAVLGSIYIEKKHQNTANKTDNVPNISISREE